MDGYAVLSGLIQLGENLYGLFNVGRFAFEAQPAFARGRLHASFLLKKLQQPEVVGAERLHHARAFILESLTRQPFRVV